MLFPPRVTRFAGEYPKHGVVPGRSFDLRLGADGRSWGFTGRDHREEVEAELLGETPVEARGALDVNAPGFGQAGVTVERRLRRP